jgi:hypothetical protein
LLLVGVFIAITLVRSAPAPVAHAQPVDGDALALDEAA